MKYSLPQRPWLGFVVELLNGLALSELVKASGGSGSVSYLPAILLALLLYCCVAKVFCNRAIKRGSYDSVVSCSITSKEQPNHDTIATIRMHLVGRIESMFVDLLNLASKLDTLKIGAKAFDGTVVHANARRHGPHSYRHINKVARLIQ